MCLGTVGAGGSPVLLCAPLAASKTKLNSHAVFDNLHQCLNTSLSLPASPSLFLSSAVHAQAYAKVWVYAELQSAPKGTAPWQRADQRADLSHAARGVRDSRSCLQSSSKHPALGCPEQQERWALEGLLASSVGGKHAEHKLHHA